MWRALMISSLTAFSLATLAFWAPAASGADTPLEAATVSDFLILCNKDTSQCDFKLRLALLNKLDARDATSVCIKDAHTEKPVIAWLAAHQETHAMATEDGIYAAYRNLYPCP